MQDRFITAVGGYLPLLRYDRAAGAEALRSFGLGGRGRGHRALSGWDEDALTLAVEAAREIPTCDKLIFASTSAPFFERAHAPLVIDALGWPRATRTNDVAGSRRCAIAALSDAMQGHGTAAIVAGDKRMTRPGSIHHLGYGDAGAAVAIGDAGSARLIGQASLAHDLLDVYASREHPTPYAYEERFARETASREVILPTVKQACAAAGVDGSAIAHAAVHEPVAGMWRDISRALGTAAPNHAAPLEASVGDLGAAHALFALALALDAAAPGDIVLVAGFGSGCDALLFEMMDKTPGARAVADSLRYGVTTDDYPRLLALTGAIDLDFGVRSEFETKTQATVIERHGRAAMGFVGGRDTSGNVQFPKTRIPVRPDADGPEPMADVRLADLDARLVSVTADRLNYTPDPPFWFGLVQFDNGARVLMELTDAAAPGFVVGDALQMRFRIKSIDRKRGMRTYFWKAAPAARPALED